MLLEIPGQMSYFDAKLVSEVRGNRNGRDATIVMNNLVEIEYPIDDPGRYTRRLNELVDEINKAKIV